MVKKLYKVAGDNPVESILTTGATFQTSSAKLYVPVVTVYKQ